MRRIVIFTVYICTDSSMLKKTEWRWFFYPSQVPSKQAKIVTNYFPYFSWGYSTQKQSIQRIRRVNLPALIL